MTTATLPDWTTRAAEIKPLGKAVIDGHLADAISGETFACLSPIDGRVLTQIPSCDSADVDRAVASARKAFESGVWRDLSAKERKKVLLRFAEGIERHGEELALLETLDMGKPISDSSKIDIPAVVDCIAWFAEAADKLYDEVAPTPSSALAMITREPVGVVAAVVPWNFPLLMAAWKLGPALASGNSVILKPAEQSPLTAIRVAQIALEAGIPPGVFNVVPGFGEKAGQALGLHTDVDCVAFTGSGEVGKLFMQYSGRSNLKRIWLECGGKTPHIVLADCHDLDQAAKAAAFGIWFNQGEVCNAGSRLLVHESHKEELLEKVVGWGKKLQPGDPLHPKTRMGAMVDRAQTERVMSYITAGQQEGARLLLGGSQVRQETGGFYIEPTIFDDVNNQMKIAREEIFGPVLSVLTFKSTEEALAIANDSTYGLAAAIWTRDVSTAHKAARALRAGVVWVNCFDAGAITTPFGGYKQSGFGRDKSLHALDKYVELKTTWIQLS